MKRTGLVLTSLLVAVPIALLASACSDVSCDEVHTCGSDSGADQATEDAGLRDGGDAAATDGATDAPHPPESGSDAMPCTGTTLTCDGMCYSPTDVRHCGSCTNDCTTKAPAHGSGTCGAGADGGAAACGFACDATYHACSGQCLPNSDDPGVADPCVLDDALGIFVAPAANGGNDASAGTKAAPVASITHALALAKSAGKRVYVCSGSYDEHVSIGANDVAAGGVAVYGGLGCQGGAWTYTGALAKVMPSSTGAALTISSVSESVLFVDVELDSLDGTAPGESSVAVFVSQSANVDFRRATIKAGKGVAGATGTMGSNYSGATAPSGNTPSTTTPTGGDGGQAACADGSSSAGGKGGNGKIGEVLGGTGGSNPAAMVMPGTYDGAGGSGNPIDCGISSRPGANGAAPSAATGASRWGTLTPSGWTPASGGAGANGNPGQGGGGGGGESTPQQGGGGGGSGGCGGAGGTLGGGGGSSFALLSFQSFVKFEASTLHASDAGSGGSGGSAQPGQAGGPGAITVCSGAYGGNGAGGAGGGGGAGGVSVGVGYVGTAPQLDAASTTNASVGAPGGSGGAGNGAAGGDNQRGHAGAGGPGGGVGKAGTAAVTQDLT